MSPTESMFNYDPFVHMPNTTNSCFNPWNYEWNGVLCEMEQVINCRWLGLIFVIGLIVGIIFIKKMKNEE